MTSAHAGPDLEDDPDDVDLDDDRSYQEWEDFGDWLDETGC